MPVIFKGTYDEANRDVLVRRWDDLRAQLHGVVIPDSELTGDEAIDSKIREVNALAPNFSPRPLPGEVA